jgi:hypothetical protein
MGTNSVARIAPQFLRGRTIHLRPNWRRDLNHVLASTERRFVDSPRTFDHRAPIIEHAHRAVTLIPTTTKPFNVLAEGLFSKKNSGRLDLDRRRKPRPTRHPGWHDRGPLLHAVLSLSLGRPSRHRPRITGDRVGMVSPEQSYIYILWMQRNIMDAEKSTDLLPAKAIELLRQLAEQSSTYRETTATCFQYHGNGRSPGLKNRSSQNGVVQVPSSGHDRASRKAAISSPPRLSPWRPVGCRAIGDESDLVDDSGQAEGVQLALII